MFAENGGNKLAGRVVIPSDLRSARAVQEEVMQQVAGRGYGQAAQFAIKLALEEALTNAIRHGNAFDPEKNVIVEFDITRQRVRIVVTDEGPGFDPRKLPDPTADENLEKPCGRGVMLINAYMDEVRYSRGGNRLEMVKYRCGGDLE